QEDGVKLHRRDATTGILQRKCARTDNAMPMNRRSCVALALTSPCLASASPLWSCKVPFVYHQSSLVRRAEKWTQGGKMAKHLYRLALAVLVFAVLSAGTALAFVCGNGLLEPGEQCDDGNTVDGDGCSAACVFESCVLTGTWTSNSLVTDTWTIV